MKGEVSMGKFRKVLSLVLSLLIVFPTFGFGQASGDTKLPKDVKGHWAEANITPWVENDLISGYPDGTFKPNGNISRAEFISMVNRIFGFYEKATSSYDDIKETDWYADEAAIAKNHHYMNWYTDSKLLPNQKITRQEVSAIISNLLYLNGSKNLTEVQNFSDFSTIPDWSREYIEATVAAGYLGGYPDKTVRAESNITRAEAVVLLDRVMGKWVRSSGSYGPETGMETVTGNLTVHAHDVTLKNIEINGDLVLAAGIKDGDVTLDNVIVKGKMVVNGGGINSIVIKGSTFPEIIIDKLDGEIRISAVDNKTGKVTLLSGGKLEGNYSDTEIYIEGEGQDIELIGDFAKITVNAETSINVAEGTKIKDLTVNATVDVNGKGTIETARINVDAVTIKPTINNPIIKEGVTFSSNPTPSVASSSSSGSSGGGNSGGSDSGNSGGDSGDDDGDDPVTISDQKAIISTIIGFVDNGNITDVPAGTTVDELEAVLTVSDKATFDILTVTAGTSAENNDILTNEMVILVTAEDGTTAEYSITIGAGYSLEHPIHIYTDQQLEDVRNGLDKHYKLEQNIDLSAFASGEGWEPIGEDENEPFTGTFDGNGKKISGLTINRNEAYYQGLFGYVFGTDALIKNINLVNVQINIRGQSGYVGGLAGWIDGAVLESCTVTGSVSSEYTVGGLVGNVDGEGKITRSYGDVKVSALDYPGGLIGFIENGTVENSYSLGAVFGAYAGGLAGGLESGKIKNSYTASQVGGMNSIGGLVGYPYEDVPNIENNVAYNSQIALQDLSADEAARITTQADSLSGPNYARSNIDILLNRTLDKGETTFDGVDITAEQFANSTSDPLSWDAGIWELKQGAQRPTLIGVGDDDGKLSQGVLPRFASDPTVTTGENGGEIILNAELNTQGTIYYIVVKNEEYQAEPSPFEVKQGEALLDGTPIAAKGSAPQLDEFVVDGLESGVSYIVYFTAENSAGIVSLVQKRVEAVAKLHMAGEGTQENPYKIVKLEDLDSIRTNSTAYYVLENNLDFNNDADYRDLANKIKWTTGEGWEPIEYFASYFGGSLDGQGHTISNLYIYNDKEIDENGWMVQDQGLFGEIDGEIKNIGLIDVDITGVDHVGGIAGMNYGIIENCFVTGNIRGNDDVGGLSGYNDGSILDSYFIGTVSGNDSIGGLAGSMYGNKGSSNNNYVVADVTGNSTVGGLGGLFYDGEIHNSYAVGYEGDLFGDQQFWNTGKGIFDCYIVDAEVSINGSLEGYETDLTTGDTIKIEIELENDTWVSDIGEDNAVTNILLNGISGDSQDANGWNNTVTITCEDVERTSDSILTITLSTVPSYNITSDETIRFLIPIAALDRVSQIDKRGFLEKSIVINAE